MKYYLLLLRPINLILLAVMQLVFHFGFLKLQNIPLALLDWQYILLVVATVCIAAAGYIINDIYDQETDAINRPTKVIIGKHIDEKVANNLYVLLNVIGVGIGFYLSNLIGKPMFAGLFILIAFGLYFYATQLKQNLLIGNIIVAAVLGLSVIIIAIFDLFPVITPYNQPGMQVLFRIILDYALFAFVINFIREIVKDMEDIKGDYNQGMNTLPIAIGVERTKKIVIVLSILSLVAILYYINKNLATNGLLYATIYGLLCVVGPLLFFIIKLFSAKNSPDFHVLSQVIKLVIFFGIFSIGVITLNILNA